MTKTPIAVVIAFALLIVGAAPALASEITVNGGGWGHGIGMPQYGAKAMAESGKTGEQIVQHFYTGAQIGTVGQGAVTGHADPLRIGVAPSSATQRFQAIGEGPVTLCLAADCSFVAQPGEMWKLTVVDANTCRYFKNDVAQGQPGPCQGQLTWGLNARVNFLDIPNTGRTYARGKVLFTQVPNNSERYHLLVEIGLEQYLWGLGEMPSSWHSQALRAQAIAARSYAVWRAWVYRALSSNAARMNQCACHLLGNNVDQVYIGWAKEAETQGSRWVDAVNSTAGKVAIHSHSGGRAIEAYYFSASGARTENNEDVWNGPDYPYLRSVNDPGARSWAAFGDPPKTFTMSTFATRLGFSSIWSAQIGPKFVSGSPSWIKVTGIKDGVTTTQSFTSNQLRQLLGLRSHFITSITGFLPSSFAHHVIGDFDGDNNDEVASFSTVDGSWWVFDQAGSTMDGSEWATVSATGWTKIVAGDFNGDGRSDVAMFHGPTAAWWVGVSNGSKFAFQRWALFSTKTGWGPQLVGDFNGDGKDDIANYYAGNGTWWVSRSTGSSFSTSLWATFSTKTGWSPQMVGDFNGDGKDDIANYYRGNGTWWVSRSTGSGFATSLWATFSTRTGWSPQLVGDFNGDGRDDIANFHSSNGSWWVSRSTGSGFSTSLKGSVSPGSGWVAQLVGDYNGDGKDDLSNYHPGNGVWAIR